MASKGFHIELVCESCGEPSEKLMVTKRFLFCYPCNEAKKRRDRFLAEEKEWNDSLTTSLKTQKKGI
jgi:hypothetical protein